MPDALDYSFLEHFRAAVDSVPDADLREELERAEEQFRKDLAEALAAKGRATDWIRRERFDRPFGA